MGDEGPGPSALAVVFHSSMPAGPQFPHLSAGDMTDLGTAVRTKLSEIAHMQADR